MRSRRARDKLFVEYEGLAVAAAERLWAKWGRSLSFHGVERDDLHSEAISYLLWLCTNRLQGKKFTKRQRVGYVTIKLGWHLWDIIRKAIYPKVPQVQHEIEESLPDNSECGLSLTEINRIYEGSEHEFALAMLNGDTVEQARKAVGWTKKVLAEHLVNMRRQL